MNKYTLVINGKCPAIGMDTDAYLQTDGILHFSGKVDSVLFDGNALAENEKLEDLLKQIFKDITADNKLAPDTFDRLVSGVKRHE